MRDKVRDFIQGRGWSDLFIGAIIGLLLTSFATPVLNPHVTRFYEDTGLYSAPPVSIEIQETGEYHPVNSSIEDFEGLEWKKEYAVYRILIQNTGEKSIDQLKFTWRAPGCIAYSNRDGPSAGGKFSLDNRGTYGIFSNAPLVVDRYQCTKVIKVIDGELSPDESLAVEFVVKSEFDKCDVLIDANPRNLHRLEYTWIENGIRFNEQRTVSPSHLERAYQQAQNTMFTGTHERIKLASGTHIHSFVVGVRGDTLSQAIEKCANSTADT